MESTSALLYNFARMIFAIHIQKKVCKVQPPKTNILTNSAHDSTSTCSTDTLVMISGFVQKGVVIIYTPSIPFCAKSPAR